jgi:SAM-dependent methyltransferase
MRFDRFADRYAETIDASVGFSGGGAADFAELKARYLARLLPPGFAGKLLDFGCGVGSVSAELARRFPAAALHGYDPSQASLARIPAAVAAGGRFTARTDELDRERAACLAGLAARLAPGGRLVVVEHNPLNPATRWVVSRCPLDDDAILLPRRETIRLLRRAGFGIERADYVTFFPRPLALLRPLERHLGWLPLGAQYAVVARRHQPAASGGIGTDGGR